MLSKTNLINEIEVGINDFLRSMVVQHCYQKGYYALSYERIGVGCEDELTIFLVTLQPYTTLTTINQVLFVLVLLVQWFQLIAQINKHLVLIHPIGEV